MKCAKLVIACINVDSGYLGQVGMSNGVPEIRKGAKALNDKYSARQQEVLTIEVFLEAKQLGQDDGPGYAQDHPIPLSDQQAAQIKTFAGGSQDAGLYVIAHHEAVSDFAVNSFGAETLAEFVNNLPFSPRKICLVACEGAATPHNSLLRFCKALTLKPPPLVAGYKPGVFISTSKNGRKYIKLGKGQDRAYLNSGNREDHKVYFQQDSKGEWIPINNSNYHDNAFSFDVKK